MSYTSVKLTVGTISYDHRISQGERAHIEDVPRKDGGVVLIDHPGEEVLPVDEHLIVVLDKLHGLGIRPELVLCRSRMIVGNVGDSRPDAVLHKECSGVSQQVTSCCMSLCMCIAACCPNGAKGNHEPAQRSRRNPSMYVDPDERVQKSGTSVAVLQPEDAQWNEAGSAG